MSLTARTRVTASSACRGTDDDVPAGDANSYNADCDACNGSPDFSFTSRVGSDACLNFFVGYMEDACSAREIRSCFRKRNVAGGAPATALPEDDADDSYAWYTWVGIVVLCCCLCMCLLECCDNY